MSATVSTASINVDGWLSLPHVRFSRINPAEHFDEHAIRLEALFDQLVLPLRKRRSIELVSDFAEETATQYRKHMYRFADVDVIVLEGIYLFKRAYRPHFDVALWVDCTFDTALERAVARAQEGLSPKDTIAAYETIYFPAQRLHFRRDDPRASANLLIPNDPAIVQPDSARPAVTLGTPARRHHRRTPRVTRLMPDQPASTSNTSGPVT
jgi:uridine kinase